MLGFAILAAACSPTAPVGDVEQIVQATFQAMTAEAVGVSPGNQAEPPSENGAEQTGSLSGQLGYPSEAIPALLEALGSR